MLKFSVHIVLLGLLSFFACNSPVTEDNPDNIQNNTDEQKDTVRTYINEYGQVQLTQINDTLWKTVFENNDGYLFDTVMTVKKRDTSSMFYNYGLSDQEFYLAYNYGGLSVSKNQLIAQEFSSVGLLQGNTRIEKLYGRAFFRKDEVIEISGDLTGGKGGHTLNEIYFEDVIENDLAYYTVNGEIKKEPYPEAYYSTDDSPQGMFPDDGKIRYRLVFTDFELEKPKNMQYTGYPVSLSDGKAAIAWDLADSEAYILEGHKTWTDKELDQKITVEGYLVQNNKGSFLKNWKIVDGH